MDLPSEQQRKDVVRTRRSPAWGIRMTCVGAVVVTAVWIAFLVMGALFILA